MIERAQIVVLDINKKKQKWSHDFFINNKSCKTIIVIHV